MQPVRVRRKRFAANQSGFNLIEVLAATAVVSIVAVGLTASTITTIKSNAFSRDAMTASSLAQDRIEELRALAPLQINQLPNGSDTIQAQSGSPEFRREWLFSPGPTAGLRQVTVIVNWNSPEPGSVRNVAYLCRGPNC